MNDKEKKALANAINVSGAFLEIQIYEWFQKYWDEHHSTGGFVHDRPLLRKVYHYQNERREVDCLANVNRDWYVVEAKQSFYSWYFVEIAEKPNRKTLYLPRADNNKISFGMYELQREISTLACDIALEIKILPSGEINVKEATAGHKIYPEGTPYAERSERGQLIQEACIQVLHNLECVIDVDEIASKGENRQYNFYKVIPLVVTNAKLFKLTVSKKDIDTQGNLSTIQEVEELPFVSFNIDWRLQNLELDNLDKHRKSVIICNLNKIQNVIDFFE